MGPSHSLMAGLNPLVFLFFLSFLIFIVIGHFVLFNDIRDRSNWIFYFWNLSFATACLGYTLFFWTSSKSEAYFFIKIASIGYCTIWPIGIHFLKTLTSFRKNKFFTAYVILLYILGIFFVYAHFKGLVASVDYLRVPYGWVDVPSKSIYYSLFLLYLLLSTVSLLLIISHIKVVSIKTKNASRSKQADITMHSAVIAIGLGLFFNIVAPNFDLDLPALGFVCGGTVWVIGMAYAISRYKFMGKISKYAGRQIFMFSENVNMTTAPNLKILEVNDAFEKMLGYGKSAVESEFSVNDLIIDAEDRLSVSEARENGEIERGVRILRKDGSTLNMNLKATFIYNHKLLVGLYLVLTDLSVITTQVAKKTRELLKLKEEAERRLKITEVYTRRSLVEGIAKGADPTQYKPKTKEIAILFSDIRDFTTLSEKHSTMTTISVLNAYFNEMNQCIHNKHGEIDKLMGDCIMAIFDDVDDSISAGIEMRERLDGFNNKHSLSVRINNGIGINWGEAILGNIGSMDKMDYTVIGDIVNVASRIESLTKMYGLPLLVSDNARNLAKKNYCCRFVDTVLVEGRAGVIHLYEIFDHEPDRYKNIKLHLIDHYKEIYRIYQRGEFEKAKKAYDRLRIQLGPHSYLKHCCLDPILDFYSLRCGFLNKQKKAGMLMNWNGVYEFNKIVEFSTPQSRPRSPRLP